jgi:hypothetical protein
VTASVAVYRYGIVSVPFARTPLGGVASFSDFQINVTYSHLFWSLRIVETVRDDVVDAGAAHGDFEKAKG